MFFPSDSRVVRTHGRIKGREVSRDRCLRGDEGNQAAGMERGQKTHAVQLAAVWLKATREGECVCKRCLHPPGAHLPQCWAGGQQSVREGHFKSYWLVGLPSTITWTPGGGGRHFQRWESIIFTPLFRSLIRK